MTNGTRTSDSRFATWIGGTVVLFFIAVAVGFVWLPSAQPGASAMDLWTAICRAVGLPVDSSTTSSRVTGQPVVDGRVDGCDARADDTRRRCARRRASRPPATTATASTASAPTRPSRIWRATASAAIYKQLEDFKSGKRNAAVMGVFVAPLSNEQLLDLATHFASFSNPYASRGNAYGGR